MKKVIYDSSVDAAYIYFQGPENLEGKVVNTYCCDSTEIGGMINIDFDKDNKIIGIEVIPASALLTRDIFLGN